MEKRTTNLETTILAYCLVDTSFLSKVGSRVSDLKTGIFEDDKYNDLLMLLYRYYAKYEKTPKQDVFTSLALKYANNINQEETAVYFQHIIKDMYERAKDDFDVEYIREETEKQLKENGFYDIQAKYAEQITSGDITDFLDELQKLDKNVRIQQQNLGTDLLDADNMFEAMQEDLSKEVVTSGYLNLDMTLTKNSGSWIKKELSVFGAISGLGKTMVMGQFAINAMKDGKNVIFYTMETPTIRLWSRFIGNLLDIKVNAVAMEEDEVKHRLKVKLQGMTGTLIIQEYNANEVCSNDIEAHVLAVNERFNRNTDIIFVDYLLLLNTNSNKLSADNSYKYYKTVTEELRNVAKNLSIPIVSAIQLNREAYDTSGGSKKEISSRNTSESMGVIHTADTVILMSQTTVQKKNNEFYMKIEKNRNGENNIILKCNVDYEKMRIKDIHKI